MGQLQILGIRLAVAVVFAFLLSRFYFPKAAVLEIIGLALGMLGLAYLLEYLKKRDKGEGHGR